MPLNTLSIITSTTSTPISPPSLDMLSTKEKLLEAMRLEGVVLGCDLVVVEAAEERNLLQDVGLDARNAVEEEDGEDAGGSTEGGADGTPVLVVRNVSFL